MADGKALTSLDRQSALGQKLKKYFTHRLEILRARNDSCPMDQTESLRGRIREVKNILNELDDTPAFVIESDDAD
jgi:hypothetical protein